MFADVQRGFRSARLGALLMVIAVLWLGCDKETAPAADGAKPHPLLAAKCKAGTKSACEELDAKCEAGDTSACEVRKSISPKTGIRMSTPAPGGSAE
jgi:hypothetical protein